MTIDFQGKPKVFLCDYDFGSGHGFDGITDKILKHENGTVEIFKGYFKNGQKRYESQACVTFNTNNNKYADSFLVEKFDPDGDRRGNTGFFANCPQDGRQTLVMGIPMPVFDGMLSRFSSGFFDVNDDGVGDDVVLVASRDERIPLLFLHATEE